MFLALANPHSAAELAGLSTLVHNLAGGLIAAVTIAMLVETLRGESPRWTRFIWPGIGLLVGLGLFVFVLLHQTLTHEIGPFEDPMQAQHAVIGLLIGIGALTEFWRRRRSDGPPSGLLATGWPLALVGVGIAFLVHEQGTAEALLVHWALAGTVILAGLALLSATLLPESGRALRLFGVLVLMGGAAQLLFYREAPGAHGEHGGDAAAPAATTPAPEIPPPHGGH
jgi:hypothetical protein